MPIKSEMIARAMNEFLIYHYNVRRRWDGDYGWGNCLYVDVFAHEAESELRRLNSTVLHEYGLVGLITGAAHDVIVCGESRRYVTIEIK